MSSILKALRKIEEEKRSAAHFAPDLRTDQGISPPKAKTWLPLLVGAFVGVAVAGAFFWYSYYVGGENPPATVHALQSVVKQQSVINSRVETNVPTVKLPPEPVADDTAQSTPPVKTLSAPAAKQTVLTPAKQPTPEQSLQSALPAKARAVEEKVAAAKPPVAATLHLTEIFYQDDPQNSMAVVNDLPVMVGTRVDSAVVLEIHQDHVVFDVDGQKYSVDVNPQQ